MVSENGGLVQLARCAVAGLYFSVLGAVALSHMPVVSRGSFRWHVPSLSTLV